MHSVLTSGSARFSSSRFVSSVCHSPLYPCNRLPNYALPDRRIASMPTLRLLPARPLCLQAMKLLCPSVRRRASFSQLKRNYQPAGRTDFTSPGLTTDTAQFILVLLSFDSSSRRGVSHFNQKNRPEKVPAADIKLSATDIYRPRNATLVQVLTALANLQRLSPKKFPMRPSFKSIQSCSDSTFPSMDVFDL